jgi:hypothetical protein
MLICLSRRIRWLIVTIWAVQCNMVRRLSVMDGQCEDRGTAAHLVRVECSLKPMINVYGKGAFLCNPCPRDCGRCWEVQIQMAMSRYSIVWAHFLFITLKGPHVSPDMLVKSTQAVFAFEMPCCA